MRRIICVLSAGVLLAAGAVSAQADTTYVPPCIDVDGGAGDYDAVTGTLRVNVVLKDPYCVDDSDNSDGQTAEYEYSLYVVRDRDPKAYPDPHAFDVPRPSEWGAVERIAVAPTSISADGKTLTYVVTVEDNDPTTCVFSLHTAHITTWTTTTDESDHDGNGTTVNDKHKTNEGDNKDGTKHDWETTTSSTTESFHDRAPDEDGDPRACLTINDAWDAQHGDSPGSGYH